jgi:hypothetical protein
MAHCLGDPIQSQLARQAQLEGQEALAPDSGGFGLKAAADQVRLTATI